MNLLRVLLWPLRSRPKADDAAAGSQTAPPAATAPFAAIRHENIKVYYAIPNYATHWRVNTFFNKEPDTLEWIAGFQPGEIMVDVGANVGMYTIWAAMTRNVRVYAFEPESQNYALLYQNIVRNNLSRQVTGFCTALSDENAFSALYLSEFVAGSSVHTLGAELDFKLEPRPSAVAQGCVAVTLDHLVSTGAVPVPNHIKIDVDGLEHKVLAGCRGVLAEPAVKSVLVELNTHLAEHQALIALLEKAGFGYSPEQVQRYMRKEGRFEGVGNYVFHR